MTPSQLKRAVADLARPCDHYGLLLAIFLAIALRAGAEVLGVLCAALTGIYGAKAYEEHGARKATALANAQVEIAKTQAGGQP